MLFIGCSRLFIVDKSEGSDQWHDTTHTCDGSTRCQAPEVSSQLAKEPHRVTRRLVRLTGRRRRAQRALPAVSARPIGALTANQTRSAMKMKIGLIAITADGLAARRCRRPRTVREKAPQRVGAFPAMDGEGEGGSQHRIATLTRTAQ
jgi:hypothetical protein